MSKRPPPSTAEVVAFPGVGRLCDLTIGLCRDYKTACQALEKIATGRIAGQKDSIRTAQIMREIAMEALVDVRYGDYASESPLVDPALSKGGGKK